VIITSAYVAAQRAKAYGDTVYRCTNPACGWQGWGTPVTYHGLKRQPGVWGYVVEDGHHMEPLERFIGHEVRTFQS